MKKPSGLERPEGFVWVGQAARPPRHRGVHRRGRRQRGPLGHPRRRGLDQLPQRGQQVQAAAVPVADQSGPRRRPGDLHEAGHPRLPQRRLEVPADRRAHAGGRRDRPARHVRQHPHRRARECRRRPAPGHVQRAELLHHDRRPAQRLHVLHRPRRQQDHGQLRLRRPRRRRRHEPEAPAGQDRRRDQRPDGRRRLPGGDRELGTLRPRPRRRAEDPGRRAQRRGRQRGLGVRALARVRAVH